MSNIENIKIKLGANSYDIVIGKNLIANSSEYISNVIPEKSKVFIVSDSNVSKLYLKIIVNSLSKKYEVNSVIINAGEKSKNINQLEDLLNNIFEYKPERSSTLIALGGGVVGDLTGFAASILLRGINFIQVPSSLLAMVDSSVGGKTGINNKFGKNLVGSFYQPKLVLSDLSVLETLPEREIQAGFAEIVKYGLINDKEFFEFLESQSDFSEINYMVKKSCEAKADIVSQDEKEKGCRALLNLGHTFGHALEALMKYDGRLLHGEGVAIGMILAFQFSEFIGICKTGCSERIITLFKNFGIKTSILELPESVTSEEIMNLMTQDKKVIAKKLVLILATDIGRAEIRTDIDLAKLEQFLNEVV